MCASVGLTGVSGVASAPVTTPWHLDRLNQVALPLDGNSALGALTGAGIDVYIIDTGVRGTHEQLAGRVVPGIDIPTQNGDAPVNPPTSDCDGHGTHVAGLAAGSTVGVAPQARIISVRVLDCAGDGSIADVVDALRWVRGHHRSGVAAIANLSLGVDLGDDGAEIDEQVLAMIKEGIVVTVAAGNGDQQGRPFDACRIAPGNESRAITVGATSITDAMTSYTNYGPCVDLFAPGGDRTRPLESSWWESDTDYDIDVGTSMASPLVAGYAALLAQQQPGLCVDAIAEAIVSRATQGVITGLEATSPNRLLHVEVSPVAATVPGQPSHVITTTDNGALNVSWDSPCDGGSPITSTRVSVLLNGKVVKKATVVGTGKTARITGLRNGLSYHVVVKAKNVLGEGIATSRIRAVRVKSLRKGTTVPVSSAGDIDSDLSLLWAVSSASTSICSLNASKTRLTLKRSGLCRVRLRAIEGQRPVKRNLRVS
jgi:subtilisin family serine protease